MSGMSPNVGGGASKEEQGQTKLGFSGLKLGKSSFVCVVIVIVIVYLFVCMLYVCT